MQSCNTWANLAASCFCSRYLSVNVSLCSFTGDSAKVFIPLESGIIYCHNIFKLLILNKNNDTDSMIDASINISKFENMIKCSCFVQLGDINHTF